MERLARLSFLYPSFFFGFRIDLFVSCALQEDTSYRYYLAESEMISWGLLPFMHFEIYTNPQLPHSHTSRIGHMQDFHG